MFLHIGKDRVIPIKDIIAIVDLESMEESEITKEFFNTALEEGFMVESSEKPKSYIITEKSDCKKDLKRGKTKTEIYSSSISACTLLKRSNFIENIELGGVGLNESE
jgi:extracellular matrix regulatory protein B